MSRGGYTQLTSPPWEPAFIHCASERIDIREYRLSLNLKEVAASEHLIKRKVSIVPAHYVYKMIRLL